MRFCKVNKYARVNYQPLKELAFAIGAGSLQPSAFIQPMNGAGVQLGEAVTLPFASAVGVSS